MHAKGALEDKFNAFAEHWRPKVIASLNDQEVKIIKVKGEFPWHLHEAEDEFFLVWKGTFRVEFRDNIVSLEVGEYIVVPRGVEHRTCADEEAEVICLEPTGVKNTGNITDVSYTAPNSVKI